MELITKLSNKRLMMLSLVFGLFIVYPNMVKLWGKYSAEYLANFGFFIFRYLFFSALIWILVWTNIRNMNQALFFRRIAVSVLLTSVAYALYVSISRITDKNLDQFSGLLIFQFIVVCALYLLLGYTYTFYIKHREKEHEIEQLKLDNLQSRCEALTNQINPHFFFNSLNGLAALVRNRDKETVLEYINKLSNVFRYILQSDRKGLVQLDEEIAFLDSFRYLQEVRYADKLSFVIDIPQNKRNLLIPALSFLPLLENVIKHNMIDSENPMVVSIALNGGDELVFSNPIQKRLDPPTESGIGLSNLISRFSLLLDSEVRVETDGGIFRVFLPLKEKSYEGIDRGR